MSGGRAVAFSVLLVLVAGDVVDAACSVSTTPISFGVYDPFSAAPNDSAGTVAYRCGPQDWIIAIVVGPGVAGSFTPRAMRDGAEQLEYNLYRDAGRSVPWGNGTGGTSFYWRFNPPNNQEVVLPIYARIPAGQDVRAGTYTDSVLVTINF